MAVKTLRLGWTLIALDPPDVRLVDVDDLRKLRERNSASVRRRRISSPF